ncbi:transmembrane protein 53-like [Glandiceps talaboti]
MAAEEDLEFYVTFPPALPPENDSTGISNDGNVESRNEPVVVLLGWSGCQDKHLAKYAAIYQQQRLATIRYILPMVDAFLRPAKVQETASKIVDLFFDLGLEKNVIFFHVFSNNGGFLYRCITEILHDHRKDPKLSVIKVGGVVFDSSPAPATVTGASSAIVTAMQSSNFILRYACAVLFVVNAMCVRFLGVFIPAVHRWDVEYRQYMPALEQDKGRYPQLFLYSKADEIVPFADIESFAEQRRKSGVPVRLVCWEDTPHCAHLTKHREEYINQCAQFITECQQT